MRNTHVPVELLVKGSSRRSCFLLSEPIIFFVMFAWTVTCFQPIRSLLVGRRYDTPHPAVLFVNVPFVALHLKIPVQSSYEAKGVAGNIIPAIATTNAIIAGLQVGDMFSAAPSVICKEDMNTAH